MPRPGLVACLTPHLEWDILHLGEQLVYIPINGLYTDASDVLDWGAYWAGHWIQAHWLPDQIERDIAWKELFVIASVVNTWGHHWPWKKLLVHCDNQAVVDIWNKGTTAHPQIMALVCMHVQHDTTSMSELHTLKAPPIVLLMHFTIFRCNVSTNWPQKLPISQIPSVHGRSSS